MFTDYPRILFHYKQGFVGIMSTDQHQEQIVKQLGGQFLSVSISRVTNWDKIKDRDNIRLHEVEVKGKPLNYELP